jgi:hypothetical protein
MAGFELFLMGGVFLAFLGVFLVLFLEGTLCIWYKAARYLKGLNEDALKLTQNSVLLIDNALINVTHIPSRIPGCPLFNLSV